MSSTERARTAEETPAALPSRRRALRQRFAKEEEANSMSSTEPPHPADDMPPALPSMRRALRQRHAQEEEAGLDVLD